jgi:hypothetical protein
MKGWPDSDGTLLRRYLRTLGVRSSGSQRLSDAKLFANRSATPRRSLTSTKCFTYLCWKNPFVWDQLPDSDDSDRSRPQCKG